MMRRFFALCALLLAGLSASGVSAEKPFTAEEVPGPLKPWLPWVMHDIEHNSCPFFFDRTGDYACSWPTSLSLDIGAKGGSFTYQFTVYDTPDKKPSRILLPGAREIWPQDVKIDKRPATVLAFGEHPSLLVSQGTYTVTGSFVWDSVPVSLHVPPEIGLVHLTVDGKEIAIPDIEEEQVWIKRDDEGKEAAQENRLDTKVFRKVTDSIPLVMETAIKLDVSGKQREEDLGKVLQEGFIPTGVTSDLPARLESDGTLRMQLRPGTWNVTITTRAEGPVTKLKLPEQSGILSSQEIWSFEPMNQLRLAEVEGVQAIDPSQTELPQEWRRFPAYLVKEGSTFTLTEKKRGVTETTPDQLNLSREIWLDFSGKGFTFKDTIGGSIRRSMRLEVADGVELGNANIDGRSQYVTRIGKDGAPGVEVREGYLSMDAGSRIESGTPQFAATGWKSSFDQVSAQLYLPPGWSLFTFSGVDSVSSSWVSKWSLLDLFLVMLTSVATYRLLGLRPAVLAIVTLTLMQHELPGFTPMVLLILSSIALVRYLPEGRLSKAIGWGRNVLFLLLACTVLPFMVQHLRQAVYPQLNPAWAEYQGEVSSATGGNSGSFLGSLGQEKSVNYGGVAGKGYAGRQFMRMHKESVMQSDAAAGAAQNELTIQPGSLPTPAPMMAPPPPPPPPPPMLMAHALPQINAAVMKKSERMDRRLRHAGAMVASYAQPPAEENYQHYAPDTKLQTGYGNADWRSNAVTLSWNGAVDPSVTLKLYLVSAHENLALALLRVVLIVAFVALLLGNQLPRIRQIIFPRGATALLLVLAVSLMTGGPVLAATNDAADTNPSFPPDALLQEMKERLEQTINEPPACAPSCATVAHTHIAAAGNQLIILQEVHAGGTIALPLPGGLANWRPSAVTVDDAPATALMQNASGYLYVNLAPGVHHVKMTGTLPSSRESVGISLPVTSHDTSAEGQGWEVQGIHENGLADSSLQLIRTGKRDSTGEKTLERTDIRPFFELERSFILAQQWQVKTTVRRITPDDSPAAIHIPLLPGETITTADIQVKDGEAYANFDAGTDEVTWQSVIMPSATLKLTAAKDKPWVEIWRLTVSNLWHATLSGIPRVYLSDAQAVGSNTNGNPANFWQWQPWPGESVTVDVARPQGVEGDTRTMDASSLQVTPGERSMELQLTLRIRSSLGGQQEVTLPQGSVLLQVERQGATLPIQLKDTVLSLPLVPGINDFLVRFKQNETLPVSFKTPAIRTGLAHSVNAETTVDLPRDRWLLFVHGPEVGPALLFWSWLPVILILSFALGKVTFTPLRMRHWFLLLLGMNQAALPASLLVALWLLALGWRRRNADRLKHDFAFNLTQLGLAVLTVISLILLFASISSGLLGAPDMHVMGSDSYGSHLHWYQDIAGQVLPHVRIVSVSIWVYRVLMLIWSLWLAFALVGWLRWGWKSFTDGGYWRAAR